MAAGFRRAGTGDSGGTGTAENPAGLPLHARPRAHMDGAAPPAARLLESACAGGKGTEEGWMEEVRH